MSLQQDLHRQHLERRRLFFGKPEKVAPPSPPSPPPLFVCETGRDVMQIATPIPSAHLIRAIQRTVSEHYGVTLIDLLSHRRHPKLVLARHVAIYLARHLTRKSFPQIGLRFGGRDHTTVLHAVRRIDRLRAEDEQLNADIEFLTAKLQPPEAVAA